MRILFVNYHHLNSNSGIHIFNLANHLTDLGIHCTVCVPNDAGAVDALGQAHFMVIDMAAARAERDGHSFDLIHAWTPRENVRSMTQELAETYGCPYVVHLEDNEEMLLASTTGMPFGTLAGLADGDMDAVLPAHLSHPRRYREFLGGALGVTVIMDTLREFCPQGKPTQVIWAGYEESIPWNMPADVSLRARLKIPQDDRVVVYTGNVHASNRNEVFSLYLAVGLLNRRGVRTWLVRTGTDFVRLLETPLGMLSDYCVNLGHVPRSDLPSILSIADVLVQPGRPDAFNTYKFPSKLPEFLASGKPVVLPATNIGRSMQDEAECLLLKRGDALEIATSLERLFRDPTLRDRIGKGGRIFAERNLPWSKSADELAGFYRRILPSQGSTPS